MNATQFKEAFPILNRALGLTQYHWQTSDYLDVCAELGLQSQWGSPEFRIEFTDAC